MEILIIGSDQNLEEAKQKFGDRHYYRHARSHDEADPYVTADAAIFDFAISDDYSRMNFHKRSQSAPVFLNSTFTTLHSLAEKQGISYPLFGFCGIPTFLKRDLLEVSSCNDPGFGSLKRACESLNTDYRVVADEVGMVTPRVIGMIINEAFMTLEEGIATREDIDLAMKLGTNYPFGPFEWSKRIGAANLVRLMDALYTSTADERYKISQLLSKEK